MRLAGVSDGACGLGRGRVSGDKRVQNTADRSTDFGLESRSSPSNSAIESENNRLGRGCSGCMPGAQHGWSRAFGILLIMSRFLGGRIPKRMSFDLSMTGYVMEAVGSGCLSSITSTVLISPRLETLASKDKGPAWMVNVGSRYQRISLRARMGPFWSPVGAKPSC